MDRVISDKHELHGGRGPIHVLLSIWAGLFAGPLAWAIHLMASFGTVEWTCETGNAWLHHAVTAGVLVIALAGGFVSWRTWRHTGRATETSGPGPRGRNHFLALAGVAVSAFFILIIVVSEIPNLLLHPCSMR